MIYLDIEAEAGGVAHRGLAVIVDGMLTVASPRLGEKSAVVHASLPALLGRLLLLELIAEAAQPNGEARS